jgi:hypothetical protein
MLQPSVFRIALSANTRCGHVFSTRPYIYNQILLCITFITIMLPAAAKPPTLNKFNKMRVLHSALSTVIKTNFCVSWH